MEVPPPKVVRSDYWVAVIYGIFCIAVSLLNFLGAIAAITIFQKIELAVDAAIFATTGVLLLKRHRLAYPILFAGFIPIAMAVAPHGIYIGHLLGAIMVCGMIVYVKQRKHLLH